MIRARPHHPGAGEFLDPVVPGIPRDTARITLRHLLTMTSGLPWRELNSSAGDFGACFAIGYGGQFLVNVPARNATIAAATAWSGVADAGRNWTLVLRTIVETVLLGLR